MTGLCQAYLLHQRPYRETSRLLYFLTFEQGRLDAVARGVRGKKGRWSGLLQPFQLLWLDWSGRGELKTLTRVEPAQSALLLKGKTLFSAMYANEILMRILKPGYASEGLFPLYQQLLQRLGQISADETLETALRYFEFDLLNELGYAIPFPETAEPETLFYYSSEGSFDCVLQSRGLPLERCFKASVLDAIAVGRLDSAAIRQDAKRLARLALQPLIGERPLKSRDYFRQYQG